MLKWFYFERGWLQQGEKWWKVKMWNKIQDTEWKKFLKKFLKKKNNN